MPFPFETAGFGLTAAFTAPLLAALTLSIYSSPFAASAALSALEYLFALTILVPLVEPKSSIYNLFEPGHF